MSTIPAYVSAALDLEPWQSQAKAGTLTADSVIHKTYLADSLKSTTDDAGVSMTTFTITTDQPDRDRDVVNADGWELSNFSKNPVVMWAHDYSQLPIGKCVNLSKGMGKMTGTVLYAPHPFAQTVKDLVKGGFLSATSVGFRPLKYNFNEERGGCDFEAQELLEFSIVPIPANPNALVEARAAGIDLTPVLAWADAVINRWQPATTTTEIPSSTTTTDTTATVTLTVEPPVVKKGRALSAANEAHVKQVHQHITDAMTHCDALLASVKDDSDVTDADNNGAPVVPANPDGNNPLPYAPGTGLIPRAFAPTDVIEVVFAEPVDTGYSVDPDLMRRALVSALDDVIAGEIRTAMNYQRGRVE